jgi:hypothetical protein
MFPSTAPQSSPSRTQTILKGIVHLTCFTIAECWLNAVNLDTLADYHEFIQNQLMLEISQQQRITYVISMPQSLLS